LAPELVGDLESGAWSLAAWTSDFVDILGDDGPAPHFRTRAKMLWDEECFYIGAEMEEPHLWATYAEHDSVIFHENDFEVFIDPDGDNHCYFEYEVNALGTDWDLFLPRPYRDQGSPHNEWEAVGLRKAVTLRGTLNDPSDLDEGWTVELAFPWDCFRFGAYGAPRPGSGSVWRVNFSRVEWDVVPHGAGYTKVEGRSEHNWVWSPQHVVDMHWPEHWGYVRFMDAPADHAYIDPDWEDRCRAMAAYREAKGAGERRGPYRAGRIEVDDFSRLTRD
jgi:hypothetical protein